MAQRREVAERVWRERLERQRRSGLTVAAFCEREGVSTAAFYSWKRRLSQGQTGGSASRGSDSRRPPRVEQASPAQPLFVPVSIRPTTMVTTAVGVRIELPGGAILHLPPEADGRLLERCIRGCIRAAATAEQPGRDAEAEPC